MKTQGGFTQEIDLIGSNPKSSGKAFSCLLKKAPSFPGRLVDFRRVGPTAVKDSAQ
jgi:hypothetical protein